MNHHTESERLIIQSNLWKQETQEFLNIIGIKKDSLCLDLGCGPKGILEELRNLVGDTGKIIGIDHDLHYLKNASQNCYYSNILLVQGTIENLPMVRNSFDLVHARFFLSLFNFPEKILLQMFSLLKRGGVIALQELDIKNMSISPSSPQWQSVINLLVSIFSIIGNSESSQIAKEAMFQFGIKDIYSRKVVLDSSDIRYTNWILNGISNSKEILKKRGLMSDKEVLDLMNDLQDILQKSQVSFPLIQTWGYKK